MSVETSKSSSVRTPLSRVRGLGSAHHGTSVEKETALPEDKKNQPVNWYRTRIDPKLLKKLHERSDVLGFLQTLSYLGVLVITGSFTFYSAYHWTWLVTLPLLFLHGMLFAFMINGVHELGHGTVFKSKWLNEFFVRVLAFLGWINFQMFQASHTRHHRYTLHPPDDLEVVLPMRLMIRHFFTHGFIDPRGFGWTLKNTVRMARGKLQGEWELELFPESSEERNLPIHWARTILVGHALILGVSVYFGLWMIPLLVTFAPFYGGWLFFLCNNTQHIGLQDNVPDFRLCCRTIILNPVLRVLYWHMN